MAIDKLIPRYLNKDDDYLLVKSVEMVDALNVQMSDDEGGNAGVIKNALGNVLVSSNTSGDALPVFGTNTVIGTTACKQTGEIFYFVHNSSNNHSIYQYTSKRNTVRLVYRDSVLGFTVTGFVKADCLVKENGDTLLYFTDGVTDPKKINATKALANTAGVSGYPYKAAGATGYTNDEKLLSITTIKAPPLEPLTVIASSDTSIDSNNITDNSFQFAYQYVYEDGELSAISPYSEIALNFMNFLDGYVTDSMKNVMNAISITYKHSKGDVSKIRILYREAGINNFSVFKDINNDRSLTTGSVLFTDSIVGANVSDNEMNKMYDAVPLNAVTQTIAGSRLAYGNYEEFYDNTTVAGGVKFAYNKSVPKLINLSTTTTGTTVTATTATNSLLFTLDLSKFPSTSSYYTNINLSFDVNADLINLSGTAFSVGSIGGVTSIEIGSTSFQINKTFIVSGYANKNALASSIASQLTGVVYRATVSPSEANPYYDSVSQKWYQFGGYLDLKLGFASIAGNIATFRILPEASGLNLESTAIYEGAAGSFEDITESMNPVVWSRQTLSGVLNQTWFNLKVANISSSFAAINLSNSYSSFKSGQRHKFGIVYYDTYNRSSAVNELGEYYNPNEGSRENGELGQTKAYVRISNSPPSWAKKWQVVYAPYYSYSFAYRYSVAEAFLGAEVTGGTSSKKKIYLSMRHLEGKQDSYKEAKGAIFNYTYAKGDKLRVVSFVDPSGSGAISYPKEYIFNIIGYEYISTSGIVDVAGSVNKSYRETGNFLIIEDQEYSNFNASSVRNANDYWDNDTIVEIYRPIKAIGPTVYREIGEVNDVIGGVHYGDRNQNVVVTGDVAFASGVATATGIPKIYPGDRLDFAEKIAPFRTFLGFVKSTDINASGNLVFTLTSDTSVNGNFGFELVSGYRDAVIETHKGDCYYRPRQVKLNPLSGAGLVSTVPSNVSGIRYVDYFVEDLSISDFYDSDVIGIGRPNVASPNVKQIERKSSITYSEPYSLDSSVLKLSSFNGGQGNFADLPNAYGAIKQMLNNGDSITVLQEVKSSLVPVNRNLVEYLDGTSNVTVSTNYLGSQSVYAGDFGTQNPESVKAYNGRVYFSDVRSGKIVRIGPDGLEPISEAKIDAYTQDKCFIIASSSGTYKTIGGIDPMHGEYDITYLTVSGGPDIDDTIAYDMEDKVWNTRYSYLPEAYEHLDNFLYTFKGGAMYRHTDAAPRNRFYDFQYFSSVKLVSAFNNSMVKTAEAFSIEGNAPWSFKFSLSGQTARDTITVSAGSLSLKEGMYYANVPRLNASSNQAVSNRAVIGYITATGTWASGVTLTIGNPITTPFQASGNTFIGALSGTTMTIYDGTNGYALIQASGTNTILLSNLSGSIATIPTGTILVADSPAFIDGDPVRGPFFIIDATNSTNTPIEAYAFNVYFTRSRLHNELVTE
jgi:hypothetical protein